MLRYPFAPLAAAMGLGEHAAAVHLGLSGSTQQAYRRHGMSEKVADRLAVKAGLLPYELWPEMLEVAIAAEEQRQVEMRRARWRRAAANKRRRDPVQNRERQRRYREESARAIAIRKRQWNEANRERVAAHSRAYRARKAAERRQEAA